MLKTTVSLQVLVANEMLAGKDIGGVEGGDKLIKKCGKLLKTRKSFKSQKLSKSQKSSKSKKESSKSGNLSNFNAKKNRLSFLTPNARTAFNYLRLAFTKALIL